MRRPMRLICGSLLICNSLLFKMGQIGNHSVVEING